MICKDVIIIRILYVLGPKLLFQVQLMAITIFFLTADIGFSRDSLISGFLKFRIVVYSHWTPASIIINIYT